MQADALAFLQAASRRFDLVFLDPPFGQQLLNPCCAALNQPGWLRPAARVYLEMERNLEAQGGLALPPGWKILRRSAAGEAAAMLAAVEE
jgi:16S rRNA (guanine966-N2)-methyltransferase